MAMSADLEGSSQRNSTSSWEDYVESDAWSPSPQTTPQTRSHSGAAALHSGWSDTATSSPASLSSAMFQSVRTDKTLVSPPASLLSSVDYDTENEKATHDIHALSISEKESVLRSSNSETKDVEETNDDLWEVNSPSPRPPLTRPWTTINKRTTSQSPRGPERSISFSGAEKETWDDDFATDAILRPSEVIVARGYQVRQNLGSVREFVRLVDRLAEVHTSGATQGLLEKQPTLWREAEAIIALSREEASDRLVAKSGILGSVGEAEGTKTRIDATMLPALVEKVSELIQQLEHLIL